MRGTAAGGRSVLKQRSEHRKPEDVEDSGWEGQGEPEAVARGGVVPPGRRSKAN